MAPAGAAGVPALAKAPFWLPPGPKKMADFRHAQGFLVGPGGGFAPDSGKLDIYRPIYRP